ncbi:hypothetical protein C1H46_009335 [Malus baccata]|uniref:Uncharacterized protein n=1 Tax=Malus baccata TaxID=106549 RepID=A0A540N3B5_MALBA|nr:hypothetical protein C1H46_009335 [Malus baccata]
MAEGKLDMPDDLLSSKPSDQSWTSKVEASGGNDEEKVLIGSSDDSKDPAASESIPLSPQWLYAKPSESKKCAAQVPLETLLIATRRKVGVWKDLMTKKIGGGLPLKVKIAVVGVKRKEKLACLVAEETEGNQNAVSTVFQ